MENVYVYLHPAVIIALNHNFDVIYYKPIKDIDKIIDALISERIADEERKIKEMYKANIILCRRVEGEQFSEKACMYMRKNIRAFLLNNIFENEKELNEFMNRFGIELSRRIVRSEKKDKVAVNVMGLLIDIDKIINLFSERLREWYGLHFPELNRNVRNHEMFCKIIKKYGHRDNINGYKNISKNSTGIDFSEVDVKAVVDFSKILIGIFKLKENLSKYMDHLLSEIMPNTKEVAGTLIAGRLLYNAGDLEKLARFPSSTIQLLGAEKALFRHLRGKGKLPKHGIIFLHPLVQKAPKKLRGKVARAVASKISIALKMDAFSEKREGKKIRKELEKRVEEILKNINK